MPDWVAEGLRLAVVALVAWITARLTMRGARQQALETERLKLRHQLTVRALDEYDALSQRLADRLMGMPLQKAVDTVDALTLLHEGYGLCNLADGVAAEADREALDSPCNMFLESNRRMVSALLEDEPNGEGQGKWWRTRLGTQLQAMIALAVLNRAVRWAARRALAAAESDQPPAEVPKRDADMMKGLQEVLAEYGARDVDTKEQASDANSPA